jgi:hypothetical protein
MDIPIRILHCTPLATPPAQRGSSLNLDQVFRAHDQALNGLHREVAAIFPRHPCPFLEPLASVNLPVSHRSLESGMIALGLICIGQRKFSHSRIERIV